MERYIKFRHQLYQLTILFLVVHILILEIEPQSRESSISKVKKKMRFNFRLSFSEEAGLTKNKIFTGVEVKCC